MAIAEGLAKSDFDVSTAVLDDPEHGLSVETLTNTDVLIWWGHVAHAEVSDEIVDRVQEAVLGGMGLLVATRSTIPGSSTPHGDNVQPGVA